MDVAMQLSIFRQFLRWLALLIFMILALLYLNTSIYSIWVSGGPSNPYAVGLIRHAIGNLCFAVAALFFGIGLFKGIRTFPAATKGSAAFILLGAIVAISPYVGRFVLIDKCLDRGGSWNHGTNQCSDEQHETIN
jgi:hypothetical protein